MKEEKIKISLDYSDRISCYDWQKIRMKVIENSIKSAHHRINDLEVE